MSLFRRRPRATSPRQATVDFWTWWAAEGHAIDPSRASRLTDALTSRLEAIHPSLDWQFGAGDRAQHRLVASAGSDAEGRVQAARWARLAPDADPRWEFAASTPRDPDALSNVLSIGGADLDLSELVFAVETDDDVRRVHVGVFHPVFPALDEEIRGQIAFLAVDWLLGEDAVERWVGALEPLTERPDPALPARDVTEAVERFERERAEHPDSWSVLEGVHDGSPIAAITRSDVRWIDAPEFDRGHQLLIRYADTGLPDGESLDRIAAIDDEITTAVGDAGIYLGREMSDGIATYYAYTDSEDPDVEARIVRLADSLGSKLASDADPGWQGTRHLTK